VTQRSRPSRVWLWFSGTARHDSAGGCFHTGITRSSGNAGYAERGAGTFAVSTFIVAALIVFGLILLRSLLRLAAPQVGARFRTKMVVGAMAISLLPVVFMFFISYA